MLTRTIACAVALGLWLCLIPATAPAADGADQRLKQLLDDVWQAQLKQWPQFATRSGDHRYNERLGTVSVAEEDRWAGVNRDFLDRLRAIPPGEVRADLRLERDLLERSLEDSLAEHEFGVHLVPISGRSGFHIEFPELPNWAPLRTVEDFENYLERLRAFGDYTDGHIELMREGIRRGLTAPAVILEGFREAIDAQIVDDPTESLFFEPFSDFPDSIPEARRDALREDARWAVSESVVPAYRRFLAFMTDEYVPNCRASIGASATPRGRDFYRHRVRRYTTLDTTPDEVHALGLREVARIRGEMDAIIERVGFDGDFAAFVAHLRDEPRYYAESEEDLLAACATILKKADGKLPELFGTLPRMPYGLKPVPDYIAPKTTAAYYMRPSGDGTKAGFFFLNTFDLSSRPLYMLEALALHEAVPGHHLQLALQQEMEGLSPLRKNGGFTAFVEGWALYAERLGAEIGFYEDPYSDFGRLSMEIWRACRLVVDTGIHFKGWTRNQAIQYMQANSAMSLHNIRAEVDRYIGWPGQALAYKSGELKIRELRERAERRLGEDFDVREFHDVVLRNGAVPLTLLDRLVDEWLAATGAEPSTASPEAERRGG